MKIEPCFEPGGLVPQPASATHSISGLGPDACANLSVERVEEGLVVLRVTVINSNLQGDCLTWQARLLAPVGFTIPLDELTK